MVDSLDEVPFFFIKNHVTLEAEKTFEPWSEGDPRAPYKDGKRKMNKYLVDPETEHACVSLTSAAPWNVRITNECPPAYMHGFIVDVDVPWDGKTIPKFTIAPNYVYQTTRGYVRYIWAFEETLPLMGSFELFAKYAKEFDRMLKVTQLLSTGVDSAALVNPRTYYDMGPGDWIMLNEELIEKSELMTIRRKVTREHDFKDLDVEIPLDKIAEQLSSRFPDPGFSWTKEWEEGLRCRRFWAPGADALSCTVKTTGIVSATQDGRDFTPWGHEDLCGHSWVAKFTRNNVSKIVGNFAMVEASSSYFELDKVNDRWKYSSSGRVRDALLSSFKVSQTTPKGANCSPLTDCLRAIDTDRGFYGMMPFIFNTNLEVTWKGKRYLNSYTNNLLMPAPVARDWGVDFPELAKHLDGLFVTDEGFEHFIYWWANVLQYAHSPKSAEFTSAKKMLMMIIAGNPSTGKNFLSGLVALSLGGWGDANHFLTTDDNFNEELADAPFWRLDDPEITQTKGYGRSAKDKLADLIKRLIANPTFTRRAMRVGGVDCPMQAPIMMTTNDDEKSLGAFPNVTSSLTGKLIVALVKKSHFAMKKHFPSDSELIKKEMPGLVATLLQVNIPDELRNDRFGVAPYFDPGVAEKLTEIDPRIIRLEAVADFVASMPGGELYGSASQILDIIHEEAGRSLTNEYRSISMLGKDLNFARDSSNPPVPCLIVTQARTASSRLWKLKIENNVDESSESD